MHGIGKRDRQEGRTQAWHSLTTIKKQLTLDDNHLTEWDIEEVPTYILDTQGDHIELPFKMLQASDDKLPIGKPYAKTYTPVTNAQFLNMVKEAISGVVGAEVDSIGSVCDRGRIFVSISIKGMEKYKLGQREFMDFLNFGSSHDQSGAVWANASNICTVCYNTFTANMDGNHKIKVRVAHKKGVVAKMENISEVIDTYAGSQARFKAEFLRLMNEPMKEDQARNFYAGFVVRNVKEDGAPRELGPKSFKKVERLTELFLNGRGNNGDDRSDCFQGGTEFFTHFSTRGEGKNAGRQIYSSEFGLGNINKQRLWNSLRDTKMVNSLITTGRSAIKDYISA